MSQPLVRKKKQPLLPQSQFPTSQQISFILATKATGNYLEASLKIPSGVTLTNIETQTHTAVTGLAAFITTI